MKGGIIVGCLLLSFLSCAGEGQSSHRESETELIAVQGLRFAVTDLEAGNVLEVQAGRARFRDLPGRGVGELEEVRVHLQREGAEALRVSAKAATMEASDQLTLVDATVSSNEGGLSVEAEQLSLDLDGAVRGRGVRATIRP